MNGHQLQKEQSRQMIEEALFSLMKEKSYTEISVSEITKRADISRRTFYRLYQGKDDVIPAYFEKLCEHYQSNSKPIQEYAIEQVAAEFFSFWYQYKEFLLMLYQSGLESMLFLGINRASERVIRSRIGEHSLQQMPELIYFVDYSTGGFINLLYRWIREGMELSPQEYAKLTGGAITKVIRQQ